MDKVFIFKDGSIYEPVPNFYDLRDFKLTKKEFELCYRIQKFLYIVNKRKDYYKKNLAHQFAAIKHVAASLQNFLLEKVRG